MSQLTWRMTSVRDQCQGDGSFKKKKVSEDAFINTVNIQENEIGT